MLPPAEAVRGGACAPRGDSVGATLADGRETRVASESGGIGGLSWSPDGAHLLSLPSAPGHPSLSRLRSIRLEGHLRHRKRSRAHACVVASIGGAPRTTDGGERRQVGGRRWLDPRHFWSIEHLPTSSGERPRSSGHHGRAGKDDQRTVEEKFWSITGDAGANAQPSPDGKWIAFVQRSRRLGSHLRRCRRPAGAASANHEGEVRGVAAAVVARQHANRVRCERAEIGYGNRQLYVATINGDPSTRDDRGDHAAAAARTSRRSGRRTARASLYQHTDPHNSADLCGRRRRRAGAKPLRSLRLDAGRRSIGRAFVEPEMVHYAGPDGQQVPAWLFVPKNLDRIEEASGHRLDSRRRREPELRRLARAAELRRLLQLPSVPAAEGLRRDRAGLPRQHRLRHGVARGRLHGRRRQGREGRVDGGRTT